MNNNESLNGVKEVNSYLKRIGDSLKVLDDKKIELKKLEDEIEIGMENKISIDDMAKKFTLRESLKSDIESLRIPSIEYNSLLKLYEEKLERIKELRTKISPSTADKLYGNSSNLHHLYKISTEEEKIDFEIMRTHYMNEIKFLEKSMEDLVKPLENLETKLNEKGEMKLDTESKEEKVETPEKTEELSIGDAKTLLEIENKLRNKTATDEDKVKFKDFIEQCKNKTGIKSTEELFTKAKEMVNPKEDEVDFLKDDSKAGEFLAKTDLSQLNEDDKAYIRKSQNLDDTQEITLDDLNNAKVNLTTEIKEKNNEGKKKITKFGQTKKTNLINGVKKLRADGVGKIFKNLIAVAAVIAAGALVGPAVISAVPGIVTGGTMGVVGEAAYLYNKGRK